MTDPTQLTTLDKSPSIWTSESQVDPRYLHASNRPPVAGAPGPSPLFPLSLYGRPPKDATLASTLDKGPTGAVLVVSTAEDARTAVASGEYRTHPLDWFEGAAVTTEAPAWYEAPPAAPLTDAQNPDPGDTTPPPVAKIAALLVLVFGLLAGPLFAQTTITQTTLSAALSAPAQGAPNTTVTLASATGVVTPTATATGSELFVDQEAMIVQSLVAGTTTTYNVIRGWDGTNAGATGAGIQHASGALVYVGPAAGVFGSPFVLSDPPVGNCTLSGEVYSLRVNTRNGRVWQCTGSTTAAVWMNVVDSYAFIGPGNCWYSIATGTLTTPTYGAVSSTTGLGLTTQIATAPAVPVMQISSTNAGVISTDTLTCAVPIPTRANLSKGVYVVDASFLYGIIGTGGVNATQVAVEASGTMNGGLVFSQVTFPAAGAAETPSTVAPVRWDAGTLVLNPAKAAFNSLVTTAGAFFTQKFTPATPMAMAADFTEYMVSMSVLCNTTQATAIYTAGVLVHYRTLTGL